MTEGTLVSIDGRAALRFERRYHHPVERVWRAISDVDEMRHWFPASVEGNRAAGSPLEFVDEAHRQDAKQKGEPTRADGPTITGTVVVYDPPKVFSFTWGGELLRFELLPEGSSGEHTTLVFTHVLSHPSVAARNGAGWHQCLAGLDRLLSGPSAGSDGDPGDWRAVYDDYIDRVGPPLGEPQADGSMTWERSTHVDPERVHAATSDSDELAAWGAGDRADDQTAWDITPTEHGSRYCLTVAGAGKDPAAASAWHALLLQLDMYLAANQLVPVDTGRWVDTYGRLLG